jgi:hypothetical protein
MPIGPPRQGDEQGARHDETGIDRRVADRPAARPNDPPAGQAREVGGGQGRFGRRTARPRQGFGHGWQCGTGVPHGFATMAVEVDAGRSSVVIA